MRLFHVICLCLHQSTKNDKFLGLLIKENKIFKNWNGIKYLTIQNIRQGGITTGQKKIYVYLTVWNILNPIKIWLNCQVTGCTKSEPNF